MILLSISMLAASVAARPAGDMPAFNPLPQGILCPETPMSLARKLGKGPPEAIPLSKLPPARAYMAVDRRIDGCPAPLTMTKYRNAHRR